ncbi:hypothetical protein CYMTET_50070, partial [Cymbomonas tetramitiformis]
MLEASPAYQILNEHQLLDSRYRLESSADINVLKSNATICQNWSFFCLSCICFPIGPCAYKCCVNEFEVPAGHVRKVEDGRGGFQLCGPGLHRLTDCFVRVHKENVPYAEGVIKHGDRTIVTIDQGYIGYASDRGQPVLLPPGLHQWKSDTLQFHRSIDLSSSVTNLGPYTLLTVDEGYAAVTQNNGMMAVLPGGSMHLLSHRNWKFEKFVSLKIQTDSLDRIQATTSDNVLLQVQSTVSWQVVNVNLAARMSTETMPQEGRGTGDRWRPFGWPRVRPQRPPQIGHPH